MAFEPAQRLRIARSEEHGEQLEGLQGVAQILELGRKLVGSATRHPGALLREAGEQQRPAEQLRGHTARLGIPQRLVGLAQVLGGGRSGRQRLRAAELEQQLRPVLGRRRLGERARQVGDRAVGRALAARGDRRAVERVDNPGLSARRGGEQVRRHLLDRGARLGQQPRRPPVLQLALSGRHVVADRCADDRMHEGERRLGLQDLRARERRHRARGPLLVEIRQRGHGREAGAGSEHRERPRDRRGVLGQPGEPEQDRARGGARADIRHQVDVGPVRAHVLGLERLEELGQQQRVAARRGVTGGREGIVGQLLQPLADEV